MPVLLGCLLVSSLEKATAGANMHSMLTLLPDLIYTAIPCLFSCHHYNCPMTTHLGPLAYLYILLYSQCSLRSCLRPQTRVHLVPVLSAIDLRLPVSPLQNVDTCLTATHC